MTIQRVDLASISLETNYGLTASATDRNTGHKFLRITDIRHGRIVWDQVPYCECNSEEAKKHDLAEGDVVFARTGSVGNSCLITNPPQGAVFASYLIRIRPDHHKVDPRFLAYFFQTTDYWRQIDSQAVGAIHQGLNASKLKQLTLPLPPLPEQQRVAGILGRADRLRRLRRYALEMSDGYLQAVFLEMFGGILHDEHRSVEMGKLVSITGGGTPSRDVDRYYTGTIPWLTSKDMRGEYIWDTQEHITEDAIAKSATRLIPAKSILVVVKSKILMRRLPLAIAMRPMCHGQDIKSIQCSDDLEPVFLLHVLRHNESRLLGQARGANTEGLNLPMLREVPVPVVALAEQRRFTHIVDRFERARVQQREALRQAVHLFQTLLHGAFRGTA